MSWMLVMLIYSNPITGAHSDVPYKDITYGGASIEDCIKYGEDVKNLYHTARFKFDYICVPTTKTPGQYYQENILK